MPFPATPSPFRPSRRTPSTRRNAGPQFAPTPRFLLSQSANDDHDVIDDEPSSTDQAAQKPPASKAAARSRQRDAIDDSDDTEVIRDRGVSTRRTDILCDDAIDSTPPENSETPGVLDADFDALFTPIGDGNKRRRVDGGTPSVSARLTQANSIPSSPPRTENYPSSPIESPETSRKAASAWEMGTQRTPVPTARPFAPPASIPGDMKTPFSRSRPRFMLSSIMNPPSSQMVPKINPNPPTISPPERRKPVFVLPRSPSPNPDVQNIPAPFSPSSRTLSRRGRNRGVSNYISGGMAAEVRSWVLEMGTKREQFLKPQSREIGSSNELGKYQVAVRVVRVTHSRLGACGSLAFLQAESIGGRQLQGNSSHDILNILVMGPPRLRPDTCGSSSHEDTAIVSPLQGDLVGIHKGLTWNLQLGDFYNQVATQHQTPNSVAAGPSEDDGHKESNKDWLVAMEWDLIQRLSDT